MKNFIFYTLKLFRLQGMPEADQLIWLYDELRSTNTPSRRDSGKTLRILHCADLPIVLRKTATKENSQKLLDFQDLALYVFNGTLTPKGNEKGSQTRARMEARLRLLAGHDGSRVV